MELSVNFQLVYQFSTLNISLQDFITLIPAPTSTNILHNIDPLHHMLIIGSHSCLTTMAFKGVGTFGTLGVDNPFFDSFQVDNTNTTNCPMVMFVIPHPSPWIRTKIFTNWKVFKSKPSPLTFFLLVWCFCDAPPSSLMNSTTIPKVKTTEGERVGAHSVARNTSGVEGRVGVLGWD